LPSAVVHASASVAALKPKCVQVLQVGGAGEHPQMPLSSTPLQHADVPSVKMGNELHCQHGAHSGCVSENPDGQLPASDNT
jgi:hypothetical protein